MDFLSQSEVDALLKTMTGEDVPEESEQRDENGPRAYDFSKQERIVRGRMPTLELIHERFSRNLQIGIFNYMRRTVDVSTTPIKMKKYSEFVSNLVVPTNLNLVQFRPLRGTALLIIEPRLVFEVVDNLFGGGGKFHTRIEGRDFTSTEMNIVQRLIEVILAEYKIAWSPVYPLDPELMRSELNPQFANIATPHEIVLTTSFRLEFTNSSGDMHLCMPYSMIEPIRSLLASPMQSDQISTDSRWEMMLRDEVLDTEVDVALEYAKGRLRTEDLMQIKPGDILPITLCSEVTGYIEGIPMLAAQAGKLNGHYAVRFDRLLREPDLSKRGPGADVSA